jgi:hypothetical protein
LWNPHSGLGLPLLHNFQSAAFSVPMIIGYLAPQRYVYTTAVVSTMLIGGLGVLWSCRRFGLRLLPSTFAATAFMLSGSFNGWLGWPVRHVGSDDVTQPRAVVQLVAIRTGAVVMHAEHDLFISTVRPSGDTIVLLGSTAPTDPGAVIGYRIVR